MKKDEFFFKRMCLRFNDDCENCGFYSECNLPEKHLFYVCSECGFCGEFHDFPQDSETQFLVINRIIPEYPLNSVMCPQCHKYSVKEK